MVNNYEFSPIGPINIMSLRVSQNTEISIFLHSVVFSYGECIKSPFNAAMKIGRFSV